MVIAVHADDESLGAGGTLLKHKQAGDQIHWVIITKGDGMPGFSEERVTARKIEIKKVQALLGVQVHEIGLTASMLDKIPLGDIVTSLSKVIKSIEPELLYIPWGGDAHSDHRIVFDALRPALKSFRYPFIKTVLAMETLSETNEALMSHEQAFLPNWWVDISAHLEDKINLMSTYVGESFPPPFPRNAEMIKHQASLRGSQMGTLAAEAFVCLVNRI